MLTNWKTISNSIKRFKSLEEQLVGRHRRPDQEGSPPAHPRARQARAVARRHPRHGRHSRRDVRDRRQQGRAGDQGSQRARHPGRRDPRFQRQPAGHRLPDPRQRRRQPRHPPLLRRDRRRGRWPASRAARRPAARTSARWTSRRPKRRWPRPETPSERLPLPFGERRGLGSASEASPRQARREPRSAMSVDKRIDDMAEITAATVKDLRERTGAGMMDCKKALDETQRRHGSRDRLAARQGPRRRRQEVQPHRRRGPGRRRRRRATAAPRSRSIRETDFVAKNEQFQDFVPQGHRTRARRPAATSRRSLAASYPGGGTVDEKLTNNVATIGENQPLRRIKPCSRSRRAWSSPTCTTPRRRASARSACSSRSRARRDAEVLERARQAARDAHRRGLPAGADAATSSTPT